MAGGLVGAGIAHWLLIGLRSIVWVICNTCINLLMLLAALPIWLLRASISLATGVAGAVKEGVLALRRM